MELRRNGAPPRDAPTPALDTDATVTVETAAGEHSVGCYTLPLAPYTPDMGDPMEIIERTARRDGEVERFQVHFTTTMPNCKEVSSRSFKTTSRKVSIMDSVPIVRFTIMWCALTSILAGRDTESDDRYDDACENDEELNIEASYAKAISTSADTSGRRDKRPAQVSPLRNDVSPCLNEVAPTESGHRGERSQLPLLCAEAAQSDIDNDVASNAPSAASGLTSISRRMARDERRMAAVAYSRYSTDWLTIVLSAQNPPRYELVSNN